MTIKPKNSKVMNRTKTIAATVAALGAAIGVSMGDVLAGSPNVQVPESGKSAISSQKLQKPDVRTPKVERELKKRPPTVSGKVFRPDVRADKSSSSGLQKRLDAQREKSGIIIEGRPGVKGSKIAK